MPRHLLLGIGPFRFHIYGLNYQSLERDFEYRWVPQERIGRRPAMQYLGPGEERVQLQGVIYPRDPRWEGMAGFQMLEAMRSAAMSGTPYGVANSNGRFFGLWCITNISDIQTFLFKDGTPQRVEFTVELTNYGSDGGNGGTGMIDIFPPGNRQPPPEPPGVNT